MNNKILFDEILKRLEKEYVQYECDRNDPICDSFFFVGILNQKDEGLKPGVKTGLAGNPLAIASALAHSMKDNEIAGMLTAAVFSELQRVLNNPVDTDVLKILTLKYKLKLDERKQNTSATQA